VAAFRKVLDRRLPRHVACSVRGAVGRMHVDQNHLDAGLDELERALEGCPSGLAHQLDRAILLRSRAECLFLLGMPERGLDDTAQAAKIFRGALGRDQEAVRVLGELAALGAVVWKSGRWQPAAKLVQEAAEGFETRELAVRAAGQRLLLAMILRKAGRLDEAEAALPREEDVPAAKREAWLHGRGEIALLTGRTEPAIRDFTEALRLITEAGHPRPAHIAELECALAEAYLEADRDQEAEALATSAGAILRAAENVEECRSLITLARLHWKGLGDGAPLWRRALEIMQTAPLVEPATRARWLEQVADKFTRAGRRVEAEEARNAAAEDWNRLGCPLESVQHQVHDDACYAHVQPDR